MRYKKGGLGLYYNYQIHDGKGKLVRKQGRRVCHSFVKAFLQHLCISMAGLDETMISITNVSNLIQCNLVGYGGSNSYWRYSSSNFTLKAPANTTTYGTVVGTDNTAVDIEDYALVAKIAHGTGAGQLQYHLQYGQLHHLCKRRIGYSQCCKQNLW